MRPALLLVLSSLSVSLVGPVHAQDTPPRRLDFSQDSIPTPDQGEERTSRSVRNGFVRDQAILGLAVYGPAFATMVGDDGVKAGAGYLVMAGGTFFAAAELTRRMNMSDAQRLLSTRMAWRSALTAGYVASAPDRDDDNGTVGAVMLLGGLGGTTAGLLVGRGLTPGEAVATAFGHDLAFTAAGMIAFAADPEVNDERGFSEQSRALAMTGAGWAGYALGRLYAGNAPYTVTAGDVSTLWLGALIGATGAGAAIVESEPSEQAVALSLLAGGLAGTWLADRALVRRYDHSRSEGNMVALGGLAGGLMGVGVGVLVAGEAEREGIVTLGFATLGAVAGVLAAERFVMPAGDQGRQLGLGRLTIDPAGIAATAMGMHGRHALGRFTF